MSQNEKRSYKNLDTGAEITFFPLGHNDVYWCSLTGGVADVDYSGEFPVCSWCGKGIQDYRTPEQREAQFDDQISHIFVCHVVKYGKKPQYGGDTPEN